jgi:hypothetical protein
MSSQRHVLLSCRLGGSSNPGVSGLQGVPSPLVQPSPRFAFGFAQDAAHADFWITGGSCPGISNEVFVFNFASMMWTWYRS